jgi:hypothetical protein
VVNVNMTTISGPNVWVGQGSSGNYEHVLKLDDNSRLRVTIHADFYPFQSRARVELWDGDKWSVVVHRVGERLLCQDRAHSDVFRKSLTADSFEPDVADIMREAIAILQ